MYYKLKKTDFEFNHLDESGEFNEHFEKVFLRKNTLYFVFKKTVTKHKNIIGHVLRYYKKQREYKCKFLIQW
jgi:hypothetical protein